MEQIPEEPFLFAQEIEWPTTTEEELYWIAQEALNNTLKHAQASVIRLYLRREGKQVILEVGDDGHTSRPSR